jgi:hypothetical protein
VAAAPRPWSGLALVALVCVGSVRPGPGAGEARCVPGAEPAQLAGLLLWLELIVLAVGVVRSAPDPGRLTRWRSAVGSLVAPSNAGTMIVPPAGHSREGTAR